MNARAKAKMGPIPWPDIKERRKTGLSAYDHERKTWRICGITINPPALTEDKKMAVEKKTIYAVMNNTDGTEGRGREYPMLFTESVITAVRVGKRKYVMGCDCPIREVLMSFYDGQWYVPVTAIDLIKPNKEDMEEQAEIERKEAAKAARNAAIEKARAAGLSDSDIEALIRRD